jgi:tetratricopeptide (TPR) repeat protein
MRKQKNILLFAFGFMLVFFAACKHQQTTTQQPTMTAPTFGTQPAPERDGGMTADQATEEELFIEGCIQKSLGNGRKAIGLFLQCIDMNPNNSAANYELAGLYSQQGQKDRALKFAKTAATLNAENNWYQLRYAELLQENGKYEEATKIFHSLYTTQSDNPDFLFRYAFALHKANNDKEALEMYSRIESLAGNSDTLINSRIAVYKEKNDLAGEETTLRNAISSFPCEIKYQYRLAEFYQRNEQAEKEMETYRTMTLLYPGAVGPHMKLAELYQKQKQHEKAFAQAVKGFSIPEALTEKVKLVETWYPTDGLIVLSAIEKKEADSLCRMLRRVHPANAEPLTLTGNYLYHEGKYKEAREEYRKAVAINEDSYETWKRILLINAQLKETSIQEKDCKTIIDLYPSQPDAYYYLGILQYNKKEYKAAIPNLESAMDYTFSNPQKDLEIKSLLVVAYRATGDTEKADDFSEDILAKDSSNLEIMAGYCASLCERHTKLYKARELMLTVVAKEPNNAHYLSILGWIEYGMGDFKAAKEQMEKALAKDPNNAQINERMGDIQFRLGNTDEAVKYWKKAKEKGGSGPALDRKISSKNMLDTE